MTAAFSHVVGSDTITVNAAGTYVVMVSITSGGTNQFELRVNGTAVAGGDYTAGTDEQFNEQVIVSLMPGDALTLTNTSTFTVTLASSLTGADITNASMLIMKIV